MNTYMFEFRCFDIECHNHFLMREIEDPTTSTGCCKVCGGAAWTIKETDMTEQEYFKRILKDPDGTIGYHIL